MWKKFWKAVLVVVVGGQFESIKNNYMKSYSRDPGKLPQ